MKARVIASFLLLSVVPVASWAQGTSPATPDKTAASAVPVCKADTNRPWVESAFRVKNGSVEAPDTAKPPEKVKLRDFLAVKVAHLNALLDQQRCATEADSKPRKIVLYLDNEPVTDLSPYPPLDPEKGMLVFRLSRTEKTRELWTTLLGRPQWSARPTQVSVGLEDRYAIDSRASIQLAVLPHSWTIGWGVLFLGLVALFVGLSKRSGMIRDDTPGPLDSENRPYSLARLQMAWWFFVILAAYLFIGMITGDFSTSLTGTALVLLSVSAGTRLGSALIDASKATPEEVVLQTQALAAVDVRLAAITAALPQATPADAVTLLTEQKSLRSRRRKLRNESEHFLIDIMSDVNGVNFHRFQMVGWTVVLTFVFMIEVYREIAMPEFSATLLGLMGISAGTFLGLKSTEPTVP
jgi:hypothetical protein